MDFSKNSSLISLKVYPWISPTAGATPSWPVLCPAPLSLGLAQSSENIKMHQNLSNRLKKCKRKFNGKNGLSSQPQLFDLSSVVSDANDLRFEGTQKIYDKFESGTNKSWDLGRVYLAMGSLSIQKSGRKSWTLRPLVIPTIFLGITHVKHFQSRIK